MAEALPVACAMKEGVPDFVVTLEVRCALCSCFFVGLLGCLAESATAPYSVGRNRGAHLNARNARNSVTISTLPTVVRQSRHRSCQEMQTTPAR
eukprot:213374-Amphidinium_carterae.2